MDQDALILYFEENVDNGPAFMFYSTNCIANCL